jgi:preprotein translocase subunit SecF
MFGIIVGTSSSIFIAAPILLYLGRDKLGGVAGRHGAMVGVASE